jgi:RNA polymerase sigma-70 factor (ECF subfamily)
VAITEAEARALVHAHQAGDERAFEQIVRTQYRSLYAHARQRLSSHESAEDAVQDTLLRAYRALPNLDGDLRLQAWLHRILTNVCHDEGNRRLRDAGLIEKLEAQPEELAPDPLEEVEVFENVRLMAEALDELPDSYRQALVLRYVDGLSFREIGEATGVSEENARARVHRGRVALHKIFTRVAIVLAFLIPGLRRAQLAKESADAAALAANPVVPDQAVSLATQLTSHVASAAPTLSRFAEVAQSFPGGKSALVTTAVAAVAAVSVPIAATTVESPKAPPKSQEAAAPLKAAGAPTTIQTAGGGTATVTAPSTTSSTLPASLAEPFKVTIAAAPAPSATSTTSTTVATTSTTTAVDTGPVIRGGITGDKLTATGTAPQYDIAGPISVLVDKKVTTGTLSGRLFVFDDGTASSDGLQLKIGDKVYDLRFNASSGTTADANGVRTFVGRYSLPGGSALSLADRGDLSAEVRLPAADGQPLGLRLDLRGKAS